MALQTIPVPIARFVFKRVERCLEDHKELYDRCRDKLYEWHPDQKKFAVTYQESTTRHIIGGVQVTVHEARFTFTGVS